MSTVSTNLTDSRFFLNQTDDSRCKCGVCGKILAKRSNLTRHFRKVHGIDPSPRNLKCKSVCIPHQFPHISQLECDQGKEHIFDEIAVKTALSRQTDTDLQALMEAENLKEEQNIRSSESKRHECPLCCKNFCRPDFPSHFENEHKIKLQKETLEFDSFSDFLEWKAFMEDETQSSYYKERNSKYGQMNYHYFICNRSGTYKPKSLCVKFPKGQGSCKMNAYCPSSIRVQERKDGNCLVTYQQVHVHHKQDSNKVHQLPAPEAQREIVRAPDEIPFDCNNSFQSNEFQNFSIFPKNDLENGENSYIYQTHNSFDKNVDQQMSSSKTQSEQSDINEDDCHLMSHFSDDDSTSYTDDLEEGSEKSDFSLHVREENLIKGFTEIVKYACTPEEYNILEYTLVTLKSKIDAVRENTNTYLPTVKTEDFQQIYTPVEPFLMNKTG